jgi:spermidine synthase
MLANKVSPAPPGIAYTPAMALLTDPSPSTRAAMVHTRGGRRTLEFAPGDVQSEMHLARPDALVLAYLRAMMCFALFAPRPRHIVMVGLGGGSLAKFCYRHFPAARITVIELRADVIALREQFHVPPDDARFAVIHGDAADLIGRSPASADVLLVDGFDADGLPGALASATFYANCRRTLRPGGVLVANVFSYERDYQALVARLSAAFDGRLCWFDGIAGNNHLLFAVNAAGGARSRALRVRDLVARRHGLGAGWLNRLLAHAVVAWLARRI